MNPFKKFSAWYNKPESSKDLYHYIYTSNKDSDDLEIIGDLQLTKI